MGDQLHVYQGCKPWRPTPEAQLVTTYDFYNVPTAGILESHGAKYLFLCIEGIASSISVWTYTLATHSEITELDRAASMQLYETLLRFMGDHPTVVAIAVEDYGIAASAYQESSPGDPRPPPAIAVATAFDLVRRLGAQLERMKRLRMPA